MIDAPARRLKGRAAAGAALWRLGSGPADRGGIVLLPGIEGDARTFCRQAPLAAQVSLWAVDLPALPSISGCADAILPLLPPGPLLLFGASFGGLVARELAAAHPVAVAMVVAAGALPSPRHTPPSLRPLAAAAELLPASMFSRLYRRRIDRRLMEEGVSPDCAAVHLRHLPAPADLRTRLRAVLAWTDAAPSSVPTWWLRGQLDREAPWTLADARRALPSADVETLPGGHRPWLTHPGTLHDRLVQLYSNAVRSR